MSLLLAVIVFTAAWEMFGRWEALTALAIVAFEPSLIAHGSIVTTDMAISATSFGAIYALYRFGKYRTWLRFLVAGVAFGLMLGAKHSAVIFAGILFVLMIADTVLFRRSEVHLSRRLIRQPAAFSGMFVIGFAILWSFYGFRYYAIPNRRTRNGRETREGGSEVPERGNQGATRTRSTKDTVTKTAP